MGDEKKVFKIQGQDSLQQHNLMQSNIIVPPELVKSFDNVCDKSLIFDSGFDSRLPKIDYDELLPGRILGKGGFCNVNEISKITLHNLIKGEECESRMHMANNYLRDGDARYAIKKLRKDLDKEDTLKGIYDLALEAKFLAVIEHPHIIKIRAVATTEYLDKDFFVILDRLYNTLEKEIEIWGTKKKKTSGMAKLLDLKGKKKKNLLIEKSNVAYDIASALGHLHGNCIIYRDLSPDNVGFDVRGEVKIFDFGLAKELLPSLKLSDGTYKLTGYTGSLRYMAPEVVLCKPYNESADVFSFGVLLWQMISCTTPYDGFSVKMYETLVVEQGYRPNDVKVKTEKIPESLQKLAESCWSDKPKERPTLEDARAILRNFIMSECSEKQRELDLDMSMRSKHGSKNKEKGKQKAQ